MVEIRENKPTLVIVLLGTFACMLNQNVISPLLPVIMAEFSVSAEMVQWLTTVYMLVSAIMIPTTAFLLERYSVRNLFIISMWSFLLGSLLLAWSPYFYVTLLGRVFQAISAGTVLPLVQTMMLLSFPKEKRGAAMGMIGLLLAFAPVVGPGFAGWMADGVGWHYLFLIISILAAGVLLGSIVFIKNTETNRKRKLDVFSVLSSSLGFGGLLYGFSMAPERGWIDILTLSSLSVGAIFLLIFTRRQLNLDLPFLELRVFSHRQYTIAVILGMITYISMTSVMVIFPLFVQGVCKYSATTSGLLMMPGAIALGVLNPLSGKLFDRYGPRIISITGFSLITVGSIGFCFLYVEISLLLLRFLLTLRMAGIGLVLMPLVTWGMNSLDDKLIAHGISVFNTSRYVAGSIGTAVLVTVISLISNSQVAVLGETTAMISGINAAGVISTLLSFICLLLTVFYVKSEATKISHLTL